VPLGDVRYPVVVVVPLTTQFGGWVNRNSALYPIIQAGSAGLPQKSVALCDQIRAVDIQGTGSVRWGGQKHYYVYARVIIECRKATERELQYGLILSSLSLLHKHRNLCSYSLSNEGKWRAKHLPLPQVRHIFQ